MRNYAVTLITILSATFAFAGPSQQDTAARLQAAGLVMNEIMAAPDKGIPEEVLHGAKCIAVIPDMAKGAFLCRRRTWSRRGYLPHWPWMERTSIHFDRWRQFRFPGWRSVG